MKRDSTSLIRKFFIHLIVSLSFLGMAFITGCKPDDELELSASSLNFLFSGDNQSVTVVSNVSWTVSSNEPSWLTVSPTAGSKEGVITVKVADNQTTSQRIATITVSGGNIKRTISVTQAGGLVSITALSFSYKGEEKTVSIQSNTSWSVTSNETSWLTVSPTSGSNSGTVTVTAKAYTSTSERTAILTIKAGDLTQTINVTQEGSPVFLNVSRTTIDMTSIKNSYSWYPFNIESNIDWTINKGVETWFDVSPTSGSNNAEIKVTVQDNTTPSVRTSSITVNGAGITRTISIQQYALSMTVSPTSLSFPHDGGQKTFTISGSTSLLDWTVSTSESSWITVSPSSGTFSGTVTVTVAPNNSSSERTAIITVKGAHLTQTITVTQEWGTFLTISPTSLSYAQSGGTQTISITSNTSWTVDRGSATWLTISPTSGSNDGTISVTASANTTTAERTATITVNGDNITQAITVIQEAKAYLTVSTTNINFSSSNGTKTFTISSNTSWIIEDGNKSAWLTISPTSGTNNGIISLTATANNTSGEQRAAHLYVRGGGLSLTIVVLQDPQATLSVSPSGFTLSSLGDDYDIYVMSNTNWTVSKGSATWLTVSPTSGSNDGMIYVKAERNTSTSERTATITVSGSGLSRTVNVTQRGAFAGPGTVSFYTRRNVGAIISVTLSGQGTQTINGFYVYGFPSCGDDFMATFTNVPGGTHSYTAVSGSNKWSGTITLEYSCTTVLLE